MSGVNLAWAGQDLLSNAPGFGFLVPSSSGLPLLGVTYDSCAFPSLNFAAAEGAGEALRVQREQQLGQEQGQQQGQQQGKEQQQEPQTRVTVMLGGARFPHVNELPADEIEAMVGGEYSARVWCV